MSSIQQFIISMNISNPSKSVSHQLTIEKYRCFQVFYQLWSLVSLRLKNKANVEPIFFNSLNLSSISISVLSITVFISRSILFSAVSPTSCAVSIGIFYFVSQLGRRKYCTISLLLQDNSSIWNQCFPRKTPIKPEYLELHCENSWCGPEAFSEPGQSARRAHQNRRKTKDSNLKIRCSNWLTSLLDSEYHQPYFRIALSSFLADLVLVCSFYPGTSMNLWFWLHWSSKSSFESIPSKCWPRKIDIDRLYSCEKCYTYYFMTNSMNNNQIRCVVVTVYKWVNSSKSLLHSWFVARHDRCIVVILRSIL